LNGTNQAPIRSRWLDQRIQTSRLKTRSTLVAEFWHPAGPVVARGGIDASLLENRPHGTCRDLVAKLGQFTVDSPVTPGRVLGSQPQDQPPQLEWGAPATGAVASRLSPASLHQIPVPPQ